MSEELAAVPPEGEARGPRGPGRRTGRSIRSRRAGGEAAPEEASGAPIKQDPPAEQPAASAKGEEQAGPGPAASDAPGVESEGVTLRRSSRPSSRRATSRRAAEAGPAEAGPAEVQPSTGESGIPAEGPPQPVPAETDASAHTPESPASHSGGVEERRRRGRRPSRSRVKPPRLSENGPVADQDGPALAPVSPATVLTDDTPPIQAAAPATIQPALPASAQPQGDQGRASRPRRRRRSSPRRDRAAYPQGQSAPLKMLIAAGKERNQIAVLQNRDLIEHYVSHDEDRSIVGNIYLGRVQNVLPGMEAAFLDIGEARNAVLYAGEVSFDEEIEGPPPRIESMLKSGQAVLAQVTKDPMGSKGARLTTEVSLAGRYVVLVPGADSMGISRRLADEERKRLRDIASRIRPARHGLIVRTAADGVSEDDLEGDINRLVRIWSEIEEKRKNAKPPKLLYSEPDLAIRGIRDLFTADVVQVIVDDVKVYEQIRDYLSEVAPVLAERVELYQEATQLFQKYQVVEQLRKAIDRKIWLKSGGHIVIDRTEAMTVIDVNTGRFVGKSNLETTVLHANLEAAEEIAKQLRLRDIGGIIVIDFIDMMHERNRQELVRTFEASLQRDKTRTQVFNISELGLLQMTRKNVSEGLLEAFSDICGKCEGRGIILTDLEQPTSEASSKSLQSDDS